MNVVLRVAWLPFCFLGALALVLSLKPVPANSPLQTLPIEPNSSFVAATQLLRSPESDARSSAAMPVISLSTSNIDLLTEPALTPTSVDLTRLSTQTLTQHLLDFRRDQALQPNFAEREYALFAQILAIDTEAALEYFKLADFSADDLFFYTFLYSDLMTNDGVAQQLVEYINHQGANLALIELANMAELTGKISLPVQREIITAFILGEANYYPLIKQTGWIDQISRGELIMAFNNSIPEQVIDPISFIADIAALNEVGTYSKLIEFIESHPNRYRVYQQLRYYTSLPLASSALRMMANFDQMNLNDQVHSALIALNFGDKEALQFLIETPLASANLAYPIDAEAILLKSIRPNGLDQPNMAWLRNNVEYLRFNEQARHFEI